MKNSPHNGEVGLRLSIGFDAPGEGNSSRECAGAGSLPSLQPHVVQVVLGDTLIAGTRVEVAVRVVTAELVIGKKVSQVIHR